MRLVCFGDRAYAAVLESDHLDWRLDLSRPVYRYDVPHTVHSKALAVLHRLGLDMGIFDLKEDENGEWVWLEVNPQGQFLFLEPLTGLPLADYFSDYLLETARALR